MLRDEGAKRADCSALARLPRTTAGCQTAQQERPTQPAPPKCSSRAEHQLTERHFYYIAIINHGTAFIPGPCYNSIAFPANLPAIERASVAT